MWSHDLKALTARNKMCKYEVNRFRNKLDMCPLDTDAPAMRNWTVCSIFVTIWYGENRNFPIREHWPQIVTLTFEKAIWVFARDTSSRCSKHNVSSFIKIHYGIWKIWNGHIFAHMWLWPRTVTLTFEEPIWVLRATHRLAGVNICIKYY